MQIQKAGHWLKASAALTTPPVHLKTSWAIDLVAISCGYHNGIHSLNAAPSDPPSLDRGLKYAQRWLSQEEIERIRPLMAQAMEYGSVKTATGISPEAQQAVAASNFLRPLSRPAHPLILPPLFQPWGTAQRPDGLPLHIVLGLPGSGKTRGILLPIIRNLNAQGIGCIFYSPSNEVNGVPITEDNALAQLQSGSNVWAQTQYPKKPDIEQLHKLLEVSPWPVFIDDGYNDPQGLIHSAALHMGSQVTTAFHNTSQITLLGLHNETSSGYLVDQHLLHADMTNPHRRKALAHAIIKNFDKGNDMGKFYKDIETNLLERAIALTKQPTFHAEKVMEFLRQDPKEIEEQLEKAQKESGDSPDIPVNNHNLKGMAINIEQRIASLKNSTNVPLLPFIPLERATAFTVIGPLDTQTKADLELHVNINRGEGVSFMLQHENPDLGMLSTPPLY